MGPALGVLMAAIVLGLFGFDMHVFWIPADMLLVGWSLGFIAPAHERARWYRW